jgi:uncharacterized protein
VTGCVETSTALPGREPSPPRGALEHALISTAAENKAPVVQRGRIRPNPAFIGIASDYGVSRAVRIRALYAVFAELRELFGHPGRRARDKQIDHIDDGARAFLAHTTFVAMGTTNVNGTGDVSPKGGPAGFVKVLDDHHVAFGELPGNNRLDGFINLMNDPRTGLIAFVPGLRETLRLNGRAMLSTDPELLKLTAIEERLPKVTIIVNVTEVFIHCGKAMLRSGMWTPDRWPDTSDMPSVACIVNAHAGFDSDPDGSGTAAALETAYAKTLWNE